LSFDRKAAYEITFSVSAREDGVPWEEEDLRLAIARLLRGVGQKAIWKGHETRSSIDFDDARRIKVTRVETRVAARADG
jgi:hypothetical protein